MDESKFLVSIIEHDGRMLSSTLDCNEVKSVDVLTQVNIYMTKYKDRLQRDCTIDIASLSVIEGI